MASQINTQSPEINLSHLDTILLSNDNDLIYIANEVSKLRQSFNENQSTSCFLMCLLVEIRVRILTLRQINDGPNLNA
jgi:hypothetical protein